MIPYCPYKENNDLEFCTKCGVGDNYLEDCAIVLDNIINKKNVNLLCVVTKHKFFNTKNLHIITRRGIKIGGDNLNLTKIKNKGNNYPYTHKKKNQ